MSLRPLFRLVCAFVLAVSAASQAERPARPNAIYIHPGQLLVSGMVSGLPLGINVVYLQGEYERYIKSGLSGIASIAYFSIAPEKIVSDKLEGDMQVGFFDIKLGPRFYPGREFNGFYVQPLATYNRILLSQDDRDESWDLAINRFGVMAYMGINGKWSIFAFDWNCGIGFLQRKSDITIRTKNKLTGEVMEKPLEEAADFTAELLLNNPVLGSNLAVGFGF